MRVSKPPQERKAELLAAARRLFDERGVDATRVSDIVKRVGVAQGVFYYYFRSKEEMVQAVAQQVDGELQQRLDAILQDEGAGFPGQLRAFIDLVIDLIDQFLADDQTRLPPAAQQENLLPGVMAGSTRRLLESLHRLIEQGVASGAVQVNYPWETAQVLLYGLRHLAEEKLPTRAMIYRITEQALGLPQNALAAKPAKQWM